MMTKEWEPLMTSWGAGGRTGPLMTIAGAEEEREPLMAIAGAGRP
jgi:hypothetical protein